MAQQQLSPMIRAKQFGLSRKAYSKLLSYGRPALGKGWEGVRPVPKPGLLGVIPYGPNAHYELRSQVETVGGRRRVMWLPWYIGPRGPYRIYDVHQSTNPVEVFGDLKALLGGK